MTREPCDEIRGFGNHRTRVPFDESAKNVSITDHPVDRMEPLDDYRDLQSVAQILRLFLGQFLSCPAKTRDAICQRAKGWTYIQIAGAMGPGVTIQAAAQRIKKALIKWPSLNFALPEYAETVRKRNQTKETK